MSKNSITIARQYPILYGYSVMVAGLLIAGIVARTHIQPPSPTTVLSAHEFRVLYIYAVLMSLAYHAVIIAFLLFSKNARRVLIVLEILLVFALLGLFASFLKPTPYYLSVGLIQVVVTAAVIWRLWGVAKLQEKVRSNKRRSQ